MLSSSRRLACLALALAGALGLGSGCVGGAAGEPPGAADVSTSDADDEGEGEGAAAPADAGPPPTSDAAPRLPRGGDHLAPALTRAAADVTGDRLADVDTCAGCHADVAAQWRASAHHWASFNNPIYRASIDRFRATLGETRSRFCAGCHDPALLVDGAMDKPIAAGDRRAHAGVTCLTCHGIDEASGDGNGSYHLASASPRLPVEGDPASVAAHRRDVARPPLRSGELCGSCHRAFLDEASGHPTFFPGTDDLGPWQASAHAGHPRRVDAPIEARDCVDCHMAKEPATLGDKAAKAGTIASHRFLGGHTWLASIRGDREAASRVAEFLAGVASVDVGAIAHGDAVAMPADAAPVAAGEHLEIEVVVRNLQVGHRFPGGTRDSHDTRVEVELVGADGQVIARSDDPHVLRAGVLGDDGRTRLAREVEDLRVGVYDHTIAPRDAIVVRYAVDLPEELPEAAWPLRIDARLVHRSRAPALAAATCEAGRKGPGAAFVRVARARSGDPVDPCAPQPATTIASASVEVGQGAREGGGRPTWERLYELGLGLTHEVQERLDRPRLALEAALAAAGDDPAAQAMIKAALSEVAARQGRVDDALALADEVAALGGPAPAVDVLRGQALAAVWRWPLAAEPFARVADAFPGDPQAWRDLALARGSAGDPVGALEAAIRGLALAPRDADLLRLQGLALQGQGRPEADAALDAYLAHRPADFGPGLRARCGREEPGCARERLPVHSHPLRLVGDAAPPRR